MSERIFDNFDTPPLAPGVYEHYKGGQYEVLGVGCHSETYEWYVVYRPLYKPAGSDMWIRPYEMFTGTVLIDGRQVPRFRLLDND